MKVSVVITILNEEKSILKLLHSLTSQTKLPNEIIIVDGGSTDSTISKISNFQFLILNQFPMIKIIMVKRKGMSRARARNLGIKLARNEAIAMTDAGCVPHKDWLEKIIEPLGEADVSAGFYRMTGKTNLQKAMVPFMGTTPDKFSDDFLPSTRSIAFGKRVLKKVGGFNENLNGAAEDTMFDYELVKRNVKIVRVKNAIVEWEMPNSILEFYKKIFGYAKGDVKTKIYIHPTKGLWSHNIHTLSIFVRYLLFGLVLLVYPTSHKSPKGDVLASWGAVGLLIYLIWSIYKTRNYVKYWQSRLFVPIIQITSDIAVMLGFIWAIVAR